MRIKSKSSNIYNQKLILNNTLAEEIIIGFFLSNLSLKKIFKESLNYYFFSITRYRILYYFLTNLGKKRKKDQILQIINELWKRKLLKKVGGIKKIINSIKTSQNFYLRNNSNMNLRYLINMLYYYYLKRLFIQYSYSIIQTNYFYSLSINQLYSLATKRLIDIACNHNLYESKHINSEMSSLINRPEKNYQEQIDILSGVSKLDQITNGFKEGDLVIIAGRPSMGKTSLAINIMCFLSTELHHQVHFFSLEMSRKEILYKILSLLSNLPVHKIQKKLLFRQEWTDLQEAGYTLMNSSLLIDDRGSSSIEYIESECQNNKANKTIIVIDYLQLIKVENNNFENRTQEIGYITRNLKLLARGLPAIAIILSQLNRNIENRTNKRPLLSDLRESGCISLFNFPKLYQREKKYFILTLHCFKKYYTLNRINRISVYKSRKQYIFSIINLTHFLLSTTHNHQILTYHLWAKEDQLKSHQFNTIKNGTPLNTKYILELKKPLFIKCLGIDEVYDISLETFHNFMVNTYIIHNSIEQDADLILMLYKKENDSKERIIDLVIAKHRHGSIGSFQLLFHADVCKFSNVENNITTNSLRIKSE